jgi:hypothetical protein
MVRNVETEQKGGGLWQQNKALQPNPKIKLNLSGVS